MGAQNTSTGSGKTTQPPAASWGGAATAAQGAQAPAPAPAPAPASTGVNNYVFQYSDGTTGNSPYRRDSGGNIILNAAGGIADEGSFMGRSMEDGSLNRATIGNVTSNGMVDTYGGYQSTAQDYYGNGNEAAWGRPSSPGQQSSAGYGYGTLSAAPSSTSASQTSWVMPAPKPMPAPGTAAGTVGGGAGAPGTAGTGFGGGGFGASSVQGPVNDASRQRVEQAILARLEPQFRQDEAAMQNKLLSAGLEVGSPVYNSELRRLQQGQNDARQQAILAGGMEESRQVGLNAALQGQGFSQGLQGAQFDNQTRQQMLSELLLQRNTPLNEMNSLRTGSQVAMPNFQGYYTNNAAAAPMFDAAQAQGKYNMAAAQNSQSGFNSMLGGLASLGSAGIMKYSDARLKANITPLGRTPGGFPVYSWDWKNGSGRGVGVIAQEVQSLYPEAVARDASGYLMVDYSKIH